MHLPHKARLGVNTISSKNLEGFCSQAQIWFTARNAPVKTSNGFCSTSGTISSYVLNVNIYDKIYKKFKCFGF